MKRAAAKTLREFLKLFPCVAILGPRQCGKTTLLEELPARWKRLDLERTADYQLIARDPDQFFRLTPDAVALDEAQRLPALFPALRVAIDRDRTRKGRFVITGSSSPQLVRAVSESLAGRVAVIDLAPFSCAEVSNFLDHPLVDALADRPSVDSLMALRPRLDLRRIQKHWYHGGYPEPWIADHPRFRQVWMEQYLRHYVERDVAALFPGLNRDKFRLFVGFLADFSGTILNVSEVARALGVSSPTARDYFEIAHGTFLWRTLPAYEKHTTKRVVKHPKGYLRDSGILHHLLHLAGPDHLAVHPRMGHSWEGYVIEEILRGFADRGAVAAAHYYRTSAGAEVDLVLEGEFGVIPVEIKHAQAPAPGRLRALSDFIQAHRCPLGIVINNDEQPRRYEEKIVGLPFACL